MEPTADYLFEVSWEVCNKVGGIYTVVRGKAPMMKEFYKDYFLIGPYFEKQARLELSEKDPPKELAKAFVEMEKLGIKCYYGSWNADSSPNVILIDFKELIPQKNDIKKMLWDDYKIDSLNADWGFEEPMLWSWSVGMLLSFIEKELPEKKIVGQFHEWLSGFAVLFLKNCGSNIKTVFTTHATMLGRTIAGSGEDLYNILDSINPEERAYRYGVQDKFLAERASANKADIFTTVSEITGIEAEKILLRKPDVILNNGLTIKSFPTIEETSIRHHITKTMIREFLTFYFFPYYTFDLEHNLTFFIVGRYEYKNKGIDVMIKTLGKLNEELKKENSERTVSVFFWIPMGVKGVNVELLENKNSYRHIKTYVQSNSQDILDKIILDVINSKTPGVKTLFTRDFLKNLEKDLVMFKRQGNPPISTHNVIGAENDPLLNELQAQGLDNREDDKVKVILYPVYLTGADGLLDLPYYDALAGSHLGIFPSYYEPWGYTPVEAAALGVASITTDLSGFGRFIEKKVTRKKNALKGIYVLKRFNKSEEQFINDLLKTMLDFVNLSHEDRVKNKLIAKNLAALTDWKYFVQNYITAHNMAFDKKS
ncbi:MAG: hypothetical protein KKA51_01365 [Nanoarchaeota archaeon]|nr:hypothetical protein [Nanoarchaeota archaeon]MBU2442650.1 hypothetical protein [Nanoarchaeota archaeon]